MLQDIPVVEFTSVGGNIPCMPFRIPTPPKPCPVCQVAMQATKTTAGEEHRCERCNVTITIAPVSLPGRTKVAIADRIDSQIRI